MPPTVTCVSPVGTDSYVWICRHRQSTVLLPWEADCTHPEPTTQKEAASLLFLVPLILPSGTVKVDSRIELCCVQDYAYPRSLPFEVSAMSTEEKFGVECKNPRCDDYIVLGLYILPPELRRDLRNYLWTGPWRLTCPCCGHVDDYDQADLVSVPENVNQL